MAPPRLSFVFVHPDLGLGGAERLVVDAALSVQARGHEVCIATAHHDPDRCFRETLSEIRVVRAGSWIPRSVLNGKFHLLFAILRTTFAGIYVVLTHRRAENTELVLVCDQVSYVVPALRLFVSAPIVFYCHFPDRLLAPKAGKWSLRGLYRKAFDRLEEWTTGRADAVVVNSDFTRSVFREEFTTLANTELEILYPPIAPLPEEAELQRLIANGTKELIQRDIPGLTELFGARGGDQAYLLSINRFERKKGIHLAVEAFALLAPKHPELRLIVAGGHDVRVAENEEVYQELRGAAEGLLDRVYFVKSFTDDEKRALLHRARVLLYTPEREHFGIVPIEAGAAGIPVVACASGGPLESIRDGRTGYLVEPTSSAFAQACERFLGPTGASTAREFGDRARERVASNFSRDSFGKKLEDVARASLEARRGGGNGRLILLAALLACVLALLLGGLAWGGVYHPGALVGSERGA